MPIQFDARLEDTRINARWSGGDTWSVFLDDGEASARIELSTMEACCLICLAIGYGETIEPQSDEEKAFVAYMYAKLKDKLPSSPRVIP